jgi:hypothetical protein
MEAGKERLTRDTVRDATRQEIEHLKRENSDLKQLVAILFCWLPTDGVWGTLGDKTPRLGSGRESDTGPPTA